MASPTQLQQFDIWHPAGFKVPVLGASRRDTLLARGYTEDQPETPGSLTGGHVSGIGSASGPVASHHPAGPSHREQELEGEVARVQAEAKAREAELTQKAKEKIAALQAELKAAKATPAPTEK